jgi:hypothetical protein
MDYPRDYNFEHFDFQAENAEHEYWDQVAPPLGSVAPDTDAQRLDGSSWRLSDQIGKPVVIEFGSFTCPIFCGHVDKMEKLAQDLTDVEFVVIYTREAHPGELHGRHVDPLSKMRAAQRLLQVETIARTVLVDSLDGAIHLSWGGGYNSVFVLDPQGHVVVRRLWNEPADVAVALRVLRSGQRPVPIESRDFGLPSDRKPTGQEILERGGRVALRDFARLAPPRILRALDRSTPAVRAELGLDAHAQGRRSPSAVA